MIPTDADIFGIALAWIMLGVVAFCVAVYAYITIED